MRHIVEGSGHPEIEMLPINNDMRVASSVSMLADSFQERIIFAGSEIAPTVKVDTFKDGVRSFIHKRKAEFSTQEFTRSAIELLPQVLKELSHNIPGLGAVIGGAFLKKDIGRWRELQKDIFHVKTLIRNEVPPSMKETLCYVLSQLQRQSYKAEQMMLGKVFQVVGSLLTLGGLVTHGATVIPGVVVGAGGSLVKARISLRSAYNYLQRKWAGQLSVERTKHARFLYGLTLLHLEHLGYYDGNCQILTEADKAVEMARDAGGDQKYMANLAADFVSTIPSLAFLKKQPPSATEIEHFLEYGFWSIMKGIKS